MNLAEQDFPCEQAARACGVTPDDGRDLLPGTYLDCRFQDSGPGIAVEILPRLFQAKVTSKTTKNQKGLGLSLAIGQAIACSHGGLLLAENLEGGGAAFQLLLPVSPSSNPG